MRVRQAVVFVVGALAAAVVIVASGVVEAARTWNSDEGDDD